MDDVDVIAALRLACEATDDYETFGRVAERILKEARPTSRGASDGGVSLLMALSASGALHFRVDVA